MTFSDPVANMIASIRNANLRFYRSLSFSFSNLKWEICKKLKENNFLSECWIDEKKHCIKVKIKYSNRDSNIHQMKKISKPSQHIHWNVAKIRKNCHNYGIFIISTSLPKKSILTHHEALAENIGGKVIFFIS